MNDPIWLHQNPYVCPHFLQVIDKGKIEVVFELGSRDGLYTPSLLSTFKPRLLCAFECNPDCLPTVRKNTAGLQNFVLCEKAIWKHDGEVSFFKHSDVGSSSILGHPRDPMEKITVPCITLDTFCAQAGISKIDLICADIEGAELEVFRGQKILKTVSYIMTEVAFDPDWKRGYPTYREMDAYLGKLGFKRDGPANPTGAFGDVIYLRA